MGFEKRDNSGLIADNERKEKATHPDMTGSVTINGTEMWISGWWKDGRRGRFLSLAFRDKDVQKGDVTHRLGTQYSPQERAATARSYGEDIINKSSGRPFKDDLDDEVPF